MGGLSDVGASASEVPVGKAVETARTSRKMPTKSQLKACRSRGAGYRDGIGPAWLLGCAVSMLYA